MPDDATTLPSRLADAMALARAGRTVEAEARLSAILRSDPGEPDALQLLGLIARQGSDNARAADLFAASLKARPTQPHVQNNLGNALLALGRTADAIAAYRAAVRLQPGYADALTNLGLAYLAADDGAQARPVLETVVAAEPRNARAWAALGRAHLGLERLKAACDAFRTALSLRPGHVATLHNYAIALRLSGQPAEAAAILDHCAAADPATADIAYNLGHARYDLGEFNAAAAAYRAAIGIDPGHRAAHDALARLHWQAGNAADHLTHYAAALSRNPADAGLTVDYANRLGLTGAHEEAAALLQAAVARGVDGAEIRERLAHALGAIGRFDAAIDQFGAAIAADPARSSARLGLARMLIKCGQAADALDTLAPVLARDPHDQQGIAYRALAWRLTGDARADALLDYDRFVQARALVPPPEWGDTAAFNARLEGVLAAMHRTVRHPLEQTLRGGTQTMGELFASPAPEIQAVRAMILSAVRDYVAGLADDPAHPFLSRKSGDIRVAGSWSVRLRGADGGHHLNHIHPAGWISSAYYVGLPPGIGADDDRAGWIMFGETSLGLGPLEQIARAIRPQVGTLVLFPSYFYHGTLPFSGDAPRTTIAFDVVPA